MDMDPMTRREADKVEAILVDLIDDLKLLSLLPEEFSSWVREETVVAASNADSTRYRQLYEAHVARKAAAKAKRDQEAEGVAVKQHQQQQEGGEVDEAVEEDDAEAELSGNHTGATAASAKHVAAADHALSSSTTTTSSPSASMPTSDAAWAAEVARGSEFAGAVVDADDDDDDVLSPEEEEERQRALKAACFVHAAAHYGDPQDGDDNEAALQVSDFALLERDLLDGATTSGTVDPNELTMHHLSTRALIDTLRDGGYAAAMRYFVKRLYTTSRSARGVRGVKTPEEKGTVDLAQMHVYGCGLVDEGMDHLRELVETLHHLIHERNQSTVNEDIHRYQLLHDAVNKDQAGTADVQVLNQRFLDVKAARRAEVAELDAEIEQLEEELLYVRQAADVELEAFQRVQETIENDHRSTLRQQLEAHRNAAEAITRKLEQAQVKDLDELNTLRSNRNKREATVSGAIADYDAQSAQLATAMRQLNQEAEEDTERIVRLEAEVQALQKQKEEHAWEVTVAEQRQEHAGVIRQRQEQDARVIQAYYRAFRARQQAQQALEKGNKKGKKMGASKK